MEKDNQIRQLKLDTQDVIIEILKDSVEDSKNIIKRLQFTIILLVILLVGTFVYYEWSFKAFMSQYNYTNEITTTTTTQNDNKVYDKNSSINANINNVKVNVPNK